MACRAGAGARRSYTVLLWHARRWKNDYVVRLDMQKIPLYTETDYIYSVSSAVIDYLYKDRECLTPKGTVGVAYVYCDYRDQTVQKGIHIIGSLVAQFLEGLQEVPASIREAFTYAENKNTELELHQGLNMLESLVELHDGSFLCIDAVDELEAETQQTLLGAMKEFLSSRGGQKTRILFTGRPHIKPHILRHFTTASSPTHGEIEIVASQNDIACFLSHYIETKDPFRDKSAMNDELKDNIITTITKKSSGMYVQLLCQTLTLSPC